MGLMPPNRGPLMPLICDRNGCTLAGEELESPMRIDGEVVCDKCYDDWRDYNSTTCPLCCESYLEDDLSDCFILVDSEYGEPGLYRVLAWPFYRQGLIGSATIYPDAVTRIGSIMPDVAYEMEMGAAAFVCKECLGRHPLRKRGSGRR